VNAFNRIVIILALLIVMVISAIFFIAPVTLLRLLIPFLQQLQTNLESMTGLNALVRLGGGLVFVFLSWVCCATILWLEVRRPRAKTIKAQSEWGEAELTTDSIASRLEYNIDQLADVIR
jgi:hypothetical protein